MTKGAPNTRWWVLLGVAGLVLFTVLIALEIAAQSVLTP